MKHIIDERSEHRDHALHGHDRASEETKGLIPFINSWLLILVSAGLILAVFLFSSCAGLKTESWAEKSRVYEADDEEPVDGVYEGAALGYRGIIRVRVGYENGAITDITVIESREDRAVGGAAMEELIDRVLLDNSTDVDAISGATETSKGFLAAVENAIMDL